MAQTDSVKVSISQETGTLEKTEIIDNSQYVLKRQEPINHLFKLQIGSTPTAFSRGGAIEFNVTAGYEQKIGKSLSINTLLDFGRLMKVKIVQLFQPFLNLDYI